MVYFFRHSGAENIMSYQWKFFRAGGFDQVKLDNILLPNINSVPALGTNAPVSTNAPAAK